MDPSYQKTQYYVPSNNTGGGDGDGDDINRHLKLWKFKKLELPKSILDELATPQQHSNLTNNVRDLISAKKSSTHNAIYKIDLEDLKITTKLVNNIRLYLIGGQYNPVADIPFTLALEKHYEKARCLASREIPNRSDLVFLCGKCFDKQSSLQIIPIELIQNTLRLKYAAFLDFETFESEARGKIYDTIISRLDREVRQVAMQPRIELQSEINPCVIS